MSIKANTWVMDLEGDGLLDTITRIHIIVCKNRLTGEYKKFFPEDLGEFKEFHKTVGMWVAHNGIKYDFPVLDKLLGLKTPSSKILDTLVLARTLNSKRQVPLSVPPEARSYRDPVTGKSKTFGPYSLHIVGYLVGLGKPQVDDWDLDMSISEDRQKMDERCTADVEITDRFLDMLENEQREMGISDFPIRVRHKVYEIIAECERNGLYLDRKRADAMITETENLRDKLGEEILEHMKPKPVMLREIELKYSKDGRLGLAGLKSVFDLAEEVSTMRAKIMAKKKEFGPLRTKEAKEEFKRKNWYFLKQEKEMTEELENTVVGPFCSFEWREFNIGSNKMVVEAMNKAGWRPVNRTKGFVQKRKDFEAGLINKEEFEAYAEMAWKVDEENLETLPDTAPEGFKKIKEWRVIDKRRDKIREFYEALREDGRMGFNITPMGTWTHRCTHTNPNFGNLAGVKLKDVIVVKLDKQTKEETTNED